MSNLDHILYDVHEYFILNKNFLRACFEDLSLTDSECAEALRLYFNDIKEEEYHNTLIPTLNRVGHDIHFAYGEDQSMYIYKKSNQVG
ncbi:hypothetical protein [Metabacillus indicus]|uniref:hypothetical protein n=1 Tax=Metabacillus indicus TaxID=246786 RepID=UPI0004930F52|nr:hypothetical protein [Metabacillus indicus]KEZ48783.1 hypothetical protein AZ46_0218020 [Metabacillus indicus LMG 22858]